MENKNIRLQYTATSLKLDTSVKILAVDDNADNLLTLKALIGEAFPLAKVLTTQIPQKAIEVAMTEDPDVILLDIVMPEVDGFDICRMIKENAQLQHIPVVFITALRGDKHSRIKALELGAEGFLTKPIDASELTAQLSAMIRIKRSFEQTYLEQQQLENLISEQSSELRKTNIATLNLLEDLKNENEARKKSEEALRSIFYNNPISMHELDSRGYTISVNDAYIQLFGARPDSSYSIFSDPQLNKEEFKDLLDKARKGEVVYFPDFLFHRKAEGDQISAQLWLKIVMFPLFGSTDSPERFVVMYEDISERKKTELKRRVQYNIAFSALSVKNISELVFVVKKELSLLIDLSYFSILFYDNNQNCLLHSPADSPPPTSYKVEMEGSLPGYMMKNGNALLLRKWDIAELVLSGKIKLTGEVPKCWIGAPLLQNGKASGAIILESYRNEKEFDATDVDILQSVALEISLFIEKREAEEEALKLSKAVIQSPVSIIITDRNGTIEYVNPKFTQVSGYTPDDVLGKNTRILKSGLNDDRIYVELWENILNKRDWRGEFQSKKKNGEIYWENVYISPILNEEGNISHFIALKEDITEKKKMIMDLIIEKEKAEAANRMKSNFFANMSHELRTPLIGINGFAEILMLELTDPNLKKMAERILEGGVRLSETLNQILDLTKMETDKMEFFSEEIDIVTEATKYVESFRYAAEKKGLEFSLSFNQPDIKFHTDQRALRSIINNLVNNAVKFTHRGKVSVNIYLISENLKIEVTDTGIGIPKENHKMIFEEFRQVSEGMNRSFEGTGLGLTLTKKLTERLGGYIALESEPGRGSTFTVVLPDLDNTRIKS